ncbi:fungal-specific transcription factor domain-containing protein [Aspergillus spectabilis]
MANSVEDQMRYSASNWYFSEMSQLYSYRFNLLESIRQSKRGRRKTRPGVREVKNRHENTVPTCSPSDGPSTVTSSDNGFGLHQPRLQHPSLLSDSQYVVGDRPTVQSNTEDATEETSCPNHELPPHRTYLGKTGYMDMFSEPVGWQRTPPEPMRFDYPYEIECVPDDLLDSYVETYFEYATVWCPVLDQDLLLEPYILASSFLQHALALCGTRIRPPLIAHSEPELHYKRAKGLFYGSCEPNPLLQIIGVMLFWWWSPGYPNIVSFDTGRWWLGVAIRLAEEIGLHQMSTKVESYIGESPGLRRRIWWTLFTRDRILSMAQGRPCLIHQDYCNLPMVTVDDFPDPTNPNALLFVHWVKLWELGGNLHRELYWPKETPDKSTPHAEMINWVKSLPAALQLPFGASRTTVFNRDVHDLHLSYLTIIILLYLSRGDHGLPTAAMPAIAAASCIARIFKDFLARGSVQFVLPQATWSIALAILALLHARRLQGLGVYAKEDIRTLQMALTKLAPYSSPGMMFSHGIQNILDQEDSDMAFHTQTPVSGQNTQSYCSPSTTVSEDASRGWAALFPYIAPQTSPLIAALLAAECGEPGNLQESRRDGGMTPFLQELVSESQDFFQMHLDF